MAVKHFHIATPEQLQTLVQFAKADASTIARMARIWRAAKDKHALLYAKAYMNADEIARSDMYMGDYKFTFDVTTTPLAKSLTALANWVDDGFAVFYNSGASDNG